MNQRFAFLIQILDKIGAPLMAAVSERADVRPGSPANEAQRMAELVSRAVQVSVSLGAAMNLSETEEGADSVRLALTALAGPLVAAHYRLHGRVPDENDLAKITKGFQTVLTFSDNFTPAQDHIKRLAALGDQMEAFDGDQATLCFLKAVTPVLEAVAEFPFGQNETTLAQDIVTKLTQKAGALRGEMFAGDLAAGAAQYYELMILSALADIYKACHLAETKKLTVLAGNAAPSMDPVWAAFETRAAMLKTLAQASVPGAGQVGSASGVGGPAQTTLAAPAAPVQPPPVQETPPVSEQVPQAAAAPPVQEPQTAPAKQETPSSGTPMGFFKPATNTPPADAAPPAAPAETQTPPPATPEQAEPVQTPPAQPFQQAPAAPPPVAEPPVAGDSSSPMSFFKPGTKAPPDGENEV